MSNRTLNSGTVTYAALRTVRKDGAHLYEFRVGSSQDLFTFVCDPDGRRPEVADSVLVFLHQDFPNHAKQVVFDVPERVAQGFAD